LGLCCLFHGGANITAHPIDDEQAKDISVAHRSDDSSPTVALLPFGNVIEHFLDSLGVSLESFCQDFTGSWMFGYVDALQRAGVRTVLICISARLAKPARFTHGPTGAAVHVLPALKSYRLLQAKMAKPSGPYGRNVRQAFGEALGSRRLFRPALAALNEAVLYLVTPPRLLARVLRREKCTALLCQEYEYPRFDVCVLLGRLLGLPVFATFQGGDYQRKRLERFSRPLAMRLCAGLIIASEAEAERVRAKYHIPNARIASIFNPVDPDIWSPGDRDAARAKLGIPPSAGVAVWHGRVSIHPKGLDTLLDAWRRACARRHQQDLRLVLIGSGNDADRLGRLIAEVGLTNVVWVQQFVNDRLTLREYLAAGDVYVFPSRHEGFPVAPLEAMACGLPVVAADASGVAEILAGGEASGGVIVPRENAEALALAIGRFLDDPVWSRDMGHKARLRVQKGFAPGVVGRQLRAFLWPAEAAQGRVGTEAEVFAPIPE
jgi:glycosyltransferase involved in cell wall biosynthesis